MILNPRDKEHGSEAPRQKESNAVRNGKNYKNLVDDFDSCLILFSDAEHTSKYVGFLYYANELYCFSCHTGKYELSVLEIV